MGITHMDTIIRTAILTIHRIGITAIIGLIIGTVGIAITTVTIDIITTIGNKLR
jgi:hypothetical protein